MDDHLLETVQEAIEKRRFIKIQYRTDIHEYLSITAIIKEIRNQEGALVLELATGEEIRFNQLVRVGQITSSNYNPTDFTCDC